MYTPCYVQFTPLPKFAQIMYMYVRSYCPFFLDIRTDGECNQFALFHFNLYIVRFWNQILPLDGPSAISFIVNESTFNFIFWHINKILRFLYQNLESCLKLSSLFKIFKQSYQNGTIYNMIPRISSNFSNDRIFKANLWFVPYPEIAYLSAFKACNAKILPGVAISLHILADLGCIPLVYAL